MFKRSVHRSCILPLTQKGGRGGKAGGVVELLRDTEERGTEWLVYVTLYR